MLEVRLVLSVMLPNMSASRSAPVVTMLVPVGVVLLVGEPFRLTDSNGFPLATAPLMTNAVALIPRLPVWVEAITGFVSELLVARFQKYPVDQSAAALPDTIAAQPEVEQESVAALAAFAPATTTRMSPAA